MTKGSIRKYGSAGALIASGLVAGGVLAGSLTANAATPSPSPGSTGSSVSAPGPHSHTAVTGSEADKVKAAVKAEHSGVTITTVQKDPDGSYDAMGTDAGGNPIAFDVSADLKTVSEHVGRPGGHRGGGMHQHAAVTGSEADKVKAAVKAEHSGVTITTVQKDADGSYDALGTDASGNRVCFDVSADLKTVAARPGPGHGPGPGMPAPAGAAPTA